MKHLAVVMLFTSVGLGCDGKSASTAEANGSVAETAPYPDAGILEHAADDSSDWTLPAKSYSSNRVTTLRDITPDNIAHLKKAWVTKLADDGQQEAAPIVWHGVMYLSTPHNHILALDAATGALKWENPYTAQYTILYFVNRGVGFADGKVFEATQDCHLIAADAATGKTIWNVRGCVDTTNSLYSMAAYPYDGKVFVGNGGGDNGTRGYMQAFHAADGSSAWNWETLKHDTWPGNSWEHGGGAVWSGISVDPETQTLFLPVGNPGPDLILTGREGPDLYTNSIVALDVSTDPPRVRWYSQLVQNDTHDVDPSMAPVLFTGRVDGHARAMVAIGNKGGELFMFDRTTGVLIHKVVVDDDYNLFTSVPTPQGTVACPNHGGGIEFNGVSYDSATNLMLIPSTDECGVWKTTGTTATYVPGRAYTGGSLPTRRAGTGVLTAIDVATGRVAWRDSLGFPAQGGVTLTATGLAFTSDLSGRIYAFDIRTGRELWRDSTGSSIVAPISIYRANSRAYLAVVSGQPGAQRTPNLPPTNGGSVVTAYALDANGPMINSSANQVQSAPSPQAPGEGAPGSTGTAPYTPTQVQTGKSVFATQCASCHGTQLEGMSAPGLTGPGFGRGNVNLSALRTIITQTMPATAPGSLTPDQYAAVIAYLLAYDCVTPSGNGAVPFPTTDQPAFKDVTIGGRSCPVK
jgi:alcohol dehydrogenase (cytochrome c)